MKPRNIGAELLEGIQAIKKGKGRRVRVAPPKNPQVIRERLQLSQSAFAALLGVSVRTLQDWEQGRRVPRGPARSLLRIAEHHPEAFLSVSAA